MDTLLLSLNEQITYILQITLAIFLGGMVGYNRQREDKPAGMRTFILVCMGTTLLTIISKNYHHYIEISERTTLEPITLAAYSIMGIGFLGGGVIFHKKDKVEGITTAASLWLVAAIGVAIGFGFYFLASFVTLAEFIIIGIVWRYSDRLRKPNQKKTLLKHHSIRNEDSL